MAQFIEFPSVDGTKVIVNVDSIIAINTSVENASVFINAMPNPLTVTVTVDQIKDALKGAGSDIIDFEPSSYEQSGVDYI